MSTEAQLLDLPQEEQKPKIKICTPKLMILSLMSLYFIGQNLYHYMTTPVPVNNNPNPPKVEMDSSEPLWEIFDKFGHYFVISVVGFIALYFLRKSNIEFEEREYERKMKEEEQKEEEERKKQAEREERIIKKLEREEKEAEEKQLQMARQQKDQNINVIPNPKDGQKQKGE